VDRRLGGESRGWVAGTFRAKHRVGEADKRTAQRQARVRVALRSSGRQITSDVCALEGIAVDFRRRVAHLADRDVTLSARETQFLRALMERRGEIIPHRDIILAVWGDLERGDAQFVRVLAGQLRNKIEAEPHRPRWVITAPGLGYRFGELAD
jgi:two-component system KDP operon response regulator KdpE